MKIAVNARLLFGNQLEGVARYTHEINRRLVQLRPQDEFLFCFDRPFLDQYIYGSNVSGKVIFPAARHPILWYTWFEWVLPGILRRWKADVFISQDAHLPLRSKVPTLLTVHDLAYAHYPDQVPLSVRMFYQRYVPKFIRKAEVITAVSQYTKTDILDKIPEVEKEIHVIPNGKPQSWEPLSGDEKDIALKKWSSGKPFFCTLGSIHPRKNILGTIEAFNLFKEKYKTEHELLIIGRMAWQSSPVQKAISQSPYKTCIHMMGFQPNESVREILGASDALLFLSFFEGFGVPLLEAMQLDVPLVYSDQSSLPEVAGAAGIPVDPNDQAAAAEAMHLVLKEDIRRKFSLEAKARLEKYDWDQSARQVSNLIDQYFS
ncbi:MAG: glycosyltransferase family 4 protein [Saprospiraceae bacterium]|nr:glycosyltransferase family 4 protein [Saprospiraceae bacterium]